MKLIFQKANLIPGGNDSVVYTTLSGSVGMLVPFTSHEDYDFFQHLVCNNFVIILQQSAICLLCYMQIIFSLFTLLQEMHMRAENPPLCGRDHLSYRSYYFPVKHVIDGKRLYYKNIYIFNTYLFTFLCLL